MRFNDKVMAGVGLAALTIAAVTLSRPATAMDTDPSTFACLEVQSSIATLYTLRKEGQPYEVAEHVIVQDPAISPYARYILHITVEAYYKTQPIPLMDLWGGFLAVCVPNIGRQAMDLAKTLPGKIEGRRHG